MRYTPKRERKDYERMDLKILRFFCRTYHNTLLQNGNTNPLNDKFSE